MPPDLTIVKGVMNVTAPGLDMDGKSVETVATLKNAA
jgi:hypothetical protein